MEDQSIFDEIYSPASEAEKAALIEKLHSGDYHLSFSALTAFAKSPRAFIDYKCAERKSTPAMLLGNILHCMILEESEVKNRYIKAPDVPMNTAAGKNEVAEFIISITGQSFETNKQGNYILPAKDELFKQFSEQTGLQLVQGSMFEEAKFRAKCLVSNRACRAVLNKITETEAFLPDDFNVAGVKFKGRIDGKGNSVILDLKNMPDATMDVASRTVWSRKLHWQAWAYDESFGGGHKCYVLAVDGTGETSALCFHETHLTKAKKQVERYVHLFKQCVFESMVEGLHIWDMSQDFWAKTEMNEEGIIYL